MRVAVTGANGQLGTDVCSVFREAGHAVTAWTHDDVEVADQQQVNAALGDIKPDVVINTAAMHNVEACEADPDQAFRVNAVGTRNLAIGSETASARFVHVSTDYIFDGEKRAPYVETDAPGPLNVYANSKVAGEFFALRESSRAYVVRISGLFGSSPCRAKGGRNFVTTMLKLASERDEVRVVNDEFVSPTYSIDAARQLLQLLNTDIFGIYHLTGEGSCSWHEFAAKIFEISGANVKLSMAEPGEFPAKVPRPMYSVLENLAMRSAGLPAMPSWEDGLRRFLAAL